MFKTLKRYSESQGSEEKANASTGKHRPNNKNREKFKEGSQCMKAENRGHQSLGTDAKHAFCN